MIKGSHRTPEMNTKQSATMKSLTINQAGENNHNWKGGRSTSSHGYPLLRMPNHPRASNGYVFEHIVVLESKLQRSLLPDEDSHHLDEIKTDNNPENLEPRLHAQHTILHWTGKHHSEESRKKMSESRKLVLARRVSPRS